MSLLEMGFPIAISHQYHQVTTHTYEHTYSNIQVSALAPLVWTKFKVLRVNLPILIECTLLIKPTFIWLI